MPFVIVFFGAGIGGTMRHGVNVAAMRLVGVNFPYGTLIINITGCLVMGLIAGWLALRGEAPQACRPATMRSPVAIIITGFVTAWTLSVWPDVVVGLAIAAMNIDAAREVWEAARAEHRSQP